MECITIPGRPAAVCLARGDWAWYTAAANRRGPPKRVQTDQ